VRWLLVLLALGAGCVSSDSVRCGDRTCPTGNKCDNAHSLCVSKDQASACAALADGDQCHADDIDKSGVCDQTFCVPGCGDGVTQDPNAVGVVEECDDGNFQSHDGCSSTCVAETPVWLERIEQWRGR
jgi:cysteine-rich repeat protein